MRVSITVNGFCAGGGHVHVTATSGEESVNMTLPRNELTGAPERSLQDAGVTEKVRELMKSRVTDLRAGTDQEIRNALQLEEFDL